MANKTQEKVLNIIGYWGNEIKAIMIQTKYYYTPCGMAIVKDTIPSVRVWLKLDLLHIASENAKHFTVLTS